MVLSQAEDRREISPRLCHGGRQACHSHSLSVQTIERAILIYSRINQKCQGYITLNSIYLHIDFRFSRQDALTSTTGQPYPYVQPTMDSKLRTKVYQEIV